MCAVADVTAAMRTASAPGRSGRRHFRDDPAVIAYVDDGYLMVKRLVQYFNNVHARRVAQRSVILEGIYSTQAWRQQAGGSGDVTCRHR